MGLFKREVQYCVICGTKVSKYNSTIKGGHKICDKCEASIKSNWVKKHVRETGKSSDYYNVDLDEMKMMQEFYSEAAKRIKQFVITYRLGDLCIDKEHGWFFIDHDAVTFYRKNLADYGLFEVYSINDVNLRYDIHVDEFPKGADIYFDFKRKVLPTSVKPPCYITIQGKLLESSNSFKQRVIEIWDEVCSYFPNAEYLTPGKRQQNNLLEYYEKHKNEIYSIALERQALNYSIYELMEREIPKKYMVLAKQYLELDKLLAAELDVLKDINQLSSANEAYDRKGNAISYYSRMKIIYDNLKRELD